MPMRQLHRDHSGFTLIELVVTLIVLGILASVALRQIGTSIDTARYEQTKNELDQLAQAIRGNPAVYGQGTRSDFGYVGDVGSFPPNLDALVQNPGGYTTWKGPYIDPGFKSADFKSDGWGALYKYSDTLIRSTGSGSNIDKIFATSHAELLANQIQGYVVDADRSVPGAVYHDSILIQLRHPNGSGGTSVTTTHPASDGSFVMSGIAIGNLSLMVIYTPLADTISLPVTVYPARDLKLTVVFPADLF